VPIKEKELKNISKLTQINKKLEKELDHRSVFKSHNGSDHNHPLSKIFNDEDQQTDICLLPEKYASYQNNLKMNDNKSFSHHSECETINEIKNIK